MKKGILINDIELGYSPMSAFTFRQVIKDKSFMEKLGDSHLYIIAQRKEITFNNFNFPNNKQVQFEIKQTDNNEVIQCTLPYFQKSIASDFSKSVELRLHNRTNTHTNKAKPPYNGTQGFTIKEFDEASKASKLLIWLTPEKLLHYYWTNLIDVILVGNYENMLKYEVHYVGKSTEQNICKRLSNHSTFQEILTNEDSLSYGNIPSNEIVILLFRIKDNNTITTWDSSSNNIDLVNYLSNYHLPTDKTVSIDAEKVLIKYLQPEYNRVLYKSYPNNDDLLEKDIHEAILYSFTDPIALKYRNGTIRGSQYISKRDYISAK
jgi:hypothetical protein